MSVASTMSTVTLRYGEDDMSHLYSILSRLWILNLIKNGENTVLFLARKVFIFMSFSIDSYKQTKNASHFRRVTANEKKQNIDT